MLPVLESCAVHLAECSLRVARLQKMIQVKCWAFGGNSKHNNITDRLHKSCEKKRSCSNERYLNPKSTANQKYETFTPFATVGRTRTFDVTGYVFDIVGYETRKLFII